ncbi:26999_t:CDS:2, partial [Racocetra persica]
RSRDYDGYDENTRQNKFKNYKTVALKTLSNSQNLNQAFLKELTLYKMFKSEVSNMVPCYGISKNLEGNYIMVMEYMSEGNLRGKPINTKEITTKLQEYYASGDLELNLDKLNIQDEQGEGSLQSHIQIPPKDSEELLKEDVLSKNEGEANKEIQEINKELEKVEKQLRSYYENSETGLKETIK